MEDYIIDFDSDDPIYVGHGPASFLSGKLFSTNSADIQENIDPVTIRMSNGRANSKQDREPTQHERQRIAYPVCSSSEKAHDTNTGESHVAKAEHLQDPHQHCSGYTEHEKTVSQNTKEQDQEDFYLPECSHTPEDVRKEKKGSSESREILENRSCESPELFPGVTENILVVKGNENLHHEEASNNIKKLNSNKNHCASIGVIECGRCHSPFDMHSSSDPSPRDSGECCIPDLLHGHLVSQTHSDPLVPASGQDNNCKGSSAPVKNHVECDLPSTGRMDDRENSMISTADRKVAIGDVQTASSKCSKNPQLQKKRRRGRKRKICHRGPQTSAAKQKCSRVNVDEQEELPTVADNDAADPNTKHPCLETDRERAVVFPKLCGKQELLNLHTGTACIVEMDKLEKDENAAVTSDKVDVSQSHTARCESSRSDGCDEMRDMKSDVAQWRRLSLRTRKSTGTCDTADINTSPNMPHPANEYGRKERKRKKSVSNQVNENCKGCVLSLKEEDVHVDNHLKSFSTEGKATADEPIEQNHSHAGCENEKRNGPGMNIEQSNILECPSRSNKRKKRTRPVFGSRSNRKTRRTASSKLSSEANECQSKSGEDQERTSVEDNRTLASLQYRLSGTDESSIKETKSTPDLSSDLSQKLDLSASGSSQPHLKMKVTSERTPTKRQQKKQKRAKWKQDQSLKEKALAGSAPMESRRNISTEVLPSETTAPEETDLAAPPAKPLPGNPSLAPARQRGQLARWKGKPRKRSVKALISSLDAASAKALKVAADVEEEDDVHRDLECTPQSEPSTEGGMNQTRSHDDEGALEDDSDDDEDLVDPLLTPESKTAGLPSVFSVDDVVWAYDQTDKQHWPAVVIEVLEGPVSRQCFKVVKTHQARQDNFTTLLCRSRNLRPYNSRNKEHFQKPDEVNHDLKRAVSLADDFIMKIGLGKVNSYQDFFQPSQADEEQSPSSPGDTPASPILRVGHSTSRQHTPLSTPDRAPVCTPSTQGVCHAEPLEVEDEEGGEEEGEGASSWDCSDLSVNEISPTKMQINLKKKWERKENILIKHIKSQQAKEYLIKIQLGKVRSKRHSLFLSNNPKDKCSLRESSLGALITEEKQWDLLACLRSALSESGVISSPSYMMEVVLPEALNYAYRKVKGISKEKADRMMHEDGQQVIRDLDIN